MNSQTQLNLDLQQQTTTSASLEARATLYRIQIGNLRKEVNKLEEKIAHHERQLGRRTCRVARRARHPHRSPRLSLDLYSPRAHFPSSIGVAGVRAAGGDHGLWQYGHADRGADRSHQTGERWRELSQIGQDGDRPCGVENRGRRLPFDEYRFGR